jgi:hypothetical protein
MISIPVLLAQLDPQNVASVAEHWDVLTVLLIIMIGALAAIIIYVYKDFRKTYEIGHRDVLEKISDLDKKLDEKVEGMYRRFENQTKEIHEIDKRLMAVEIKLGLEKLSFKPEEEG